MSDAPQVLLAYHLKALKLPTFLREYDKVARQCAAEGVDYPRFLLRLAEQELIDRERRMVERRIKAAKFPTVKSLDSFDFAALPSLNKALVMELARCEYVERRENIIALGNSGTGKSHIALGLGLAACQKGLSVGFTAAAAIVHELMEARDEKRLLRLQRQLVAYKLLIVDERTSVFGAERLTGALLGRLTHHVHILEMNGDSYRLAHSKRRSRRHRADATPQAPAQD
jgi:DNA replication protein DnaC